MMHGLTRWAVGWVALLIFCLGILGLPADAIAQEAVNISFGKLPLANVSVDRPTSIQFGPDGRLYVAEVNGQILAFTIAQQNDEYIAIASEELLLPDGSEIVRSIQNHNDDGLPIHPNDPGAPNNIDDRLTTGLIVAGTAERPVLYISSADPRLAKDQDTNLDTNSGVVTRVTWTGTEWDAIDIIRGLPRSEENHSLNGMVLSTDDTKLYLTVGGNTNNGAPSKFFAYTAEYALSGTLVEIDLDDINRRPILTDPVGGENGLSRKYIYDLPTLDDPTVDNVTDGVGEDVSGLDEAGPWGGKDGFNMAILPADAPLRIYCDGLRNNYDLVLAESGKFYTVDNGSNGGKLGGNPLDANGTPTDQPGAGLATNAPNEKGTGDPEPLFLLGDGSYHGHPVPVRANQHLAWTVYDDAGNPDGSLTPNTVPDVSALVPSSINIQPGFLIDPSKFTSDPARLAQSGIRIDRRSPESDTLVNLGSSSNGLAEYTGDAFDSLLQGDLLVTQFNSNVTLLHLSEDGASVEPLVHPGNDGMQGTADDVVIDEDGVYPLLPSFVQPLDVTMGPDDTIWVADFRGREISVFAPSDVAVLPNDDFDNDGILNVNDPFIRDANNGKSIMAVSGQPLLWDFDADQDGNLPGPDGYGGGLTGVMINGSTDFEKFFQAPSSLPGQLVKLDNVKFTTAAGGGATVVENVSNGRPFTTTNTGEYLFHTGVTIDPAADIFTIKWGLFNPASALTGPSQEIGGYIGTGDQSNYLKLVAVQDTGGEIQVLLEDNDAVQSSLFIQADDLFTVPDNQKIFLALQVDPAAATAIPTITYQMGDGSTQTVTGTAIDLSDTAVLDVIRGDYTVEGQTTGLAVGLLASNMGQPEANTFSAVFDDIEVVAERLPEVTVPVLTIGDITVNEADGTAEFTVSLSAAATDEVTVSYATADGTATQGSDYRASSGNLTFEIGTVTQSIIVNLLDDDAVEGDHDFQVNLSDAVAAVISDSIGTATIQDDDSNVLYRVDVGGAGIVAPDGDLPWSADTPTNPSPYRVGIGGDRIYTSGNSVNLSSPTLPTGSQVQSIFQTVRYDPKANPTMKWAFNVEPGSEVEVRLYFSEWWTTEVGKRVFDVAIEGSVPNVFEDIDVVALSGNKRIGHMLSYATPVADGTLDLEFFHGAAGNPWLSGIEVLAAGNIPPALSIADVSVDEAAGISTFTVDLSKASAEPITVDYATTDDTAAADLDYTAANGTLTFAAGETTQIFTVNITDDTDFEGNEAFVVNLSHVTGSATLADSVGIGTIDDDDRPDSGVLYRINVGGDEVAAPDGDLPWSVDTTANPSPHRIGAGGDRIYLSNNSVNLNSPTLPDGALAQAIFQTVRYDRKAAPDMKWAFDVDPGSEVEVRLYFAEWWTNSAGDRIFDVAVEGTVPTAFEDIDPAAIAGSKRVGFMLSHTTHVADDTLDLEFLRGAAGNPWLSGIEILVTEGEVLSPTL